MLLIPAISFCPQSAEDIFMAVSSDKYSLVLTVMISVLFVFIKFLIS